MKVLYLKRDNFKTDYRNNKWRKILYHYRLRNKLSGQNGFFEGALHSVFKVTEISWYVLKHLPFKMFGNYDVIVVNNKSSITVDEIKKFFSYFHTFPKIYFSTSAKIQKMKSNKILDHFDIVFKREPYKDLDRYESLSEKNKMKIRPTILSCPLIRIEKSEAQDYALKDIEDAKFTNKAYDVSFSGKGTSKQRYLVCNEVSAINNLNYFLSIYGRRRNKMPDFISPNIQDSMLGMEDYLKLIHETKINLAPEGIGQFTHRHLELWYLGAFMLSNPAINEIQLPHGNQLENIHYAVYKNNKDLADKIHYYLHHENERKKIAAAGQELFKQIYDFKKHGRYIKECIEAL